MVADQIRDLIITGSLEVGEAISEGSLSARLGVSRAPIRAAFALLQSERLLEVRPQRGTFVFHYDTTILREICELRNVLETGALQIAIVERRDRLIADLREQVRAADLVKPRRPAEYQPFDASFHDALVRAADNSELVEAYAKISGRIRAVRYRLAQTMDQVKASQVEHRQIVAHLEAGEDVEAKALLSHHMYRSYRLFIEAAATRSIEGSAMAG